MRSPRHRLLDILEAIRRIESQSTRGKDVFDRDELVQVWVIHHLQLIGEAARALPEDLHTSHPEVPWSLIIGMRNIVVHEYFGLDMREVWATVERDLPQLRSAIEKMLTVMDSEA